MRGAVITPPLGLVGCFLCFVFVFFLFVCGFFGCLLCCFFCRAVNLRGDLSGLIVAFLFSCAFLVFGRVLGLFRLGGCVTHTQHGSEVIMNIFDNYKSRYEGAREEELNINE